MQQINIINDNTRLPHLGIRVWMLTCVDVCWRMLTYAAVSWRTWDVPVPALACHTSRSASVCVCGSLQRGCCRRWRGCNALGRGSHVSEKQNNWCTSGSDSRHLGSGGTLQKKKSSRTNQALKENKHTSMLRSCRCMPCRCMPCRTYAYARHTHTPTQDIHIPQDLVLVVV